MQPIYNGTSLRALVSDDPENPTAVPPVWTSDDGPVPECPVDSASEADSPGATRSSRRLLAERVLRIPSPTAEISVGVFCGLLLLFSGASPTGAGFTDLIVVVSTVSLAVWAMAAAPWYLMPFVLMVATLMAWPGGWGWFGGFVVGVSMWLNRKDKVPLVVSSCLAGIALVVFGHSHNFGRTGTNAAIAVMCCGVVSVAGLMTRPAPVRRRVVRWGVGAVVFVTVAGIGVLVAGWRSRVAFTQGDAATRVAIQEIRDGDVVGARDALEDATNNLGTASRWMGSLLTRPALVVPVLAQQVRSTDLVFSSAARATDVVAVELAELDTALGRPKDGTIDLGAVRQASTSFEKINSSLTNLAQDADNADNVWLVPRLRSGLSELRSRLEVQQERGADLQRIVDELPALLGADGERTYFVMFTTPAEIRGGGGFMGNYAEINVNDGHISVAKVGRTAELNNPPSKFVLHDPPQDWVARYGEEGFAMLGTGWVADDIWSNINLSAHFPYTAAAVADLYPQNGGRPVDGVISLDVFALQAIVGVVGPIPVADGSVELNGETTADYLLVDQYRFEGDEANGQRINGLSELASATTERLISADPGDLIRVASALAPMVAERHVFVWLADPDEQLMVQNAGLDGRMLADLGSRDGVSLVMNNKGANKLDTYLERSLDYRSDPQGDIVDVLVTNNAPIDELSSFVVGNARGLPPGWSRESLTLNTNRPLAAVYIDALPTFVRTTREAGVNNYTTVLALEPHVPHLVRFVLGGSAASELVIEPQPMATPLPVTVDGTAIGNVTSRVTVVRADSGGTPAFVRTN